MKSHVQILKFQGIKGAGRSGTFGHFRLSGGEWFRFGLKQQFSVIWGGSTRRTAIGFRVVQSRAVEKDLRGFALEGDWFELVHVSQFQVGLGQQFRVILGGGLSRNAVGLWMLQGTRQSHGRWFGRSGLGQDKSYVVQAWWFRPGWKWWFGLVCDCGIARVCYFRLSCYWRRGQGFDRASLVLVLGTIAVVLSEGFPKLHVHNTKLRRFCNAFLSCAARCRAKRS